MPYNDRSCIAERKAEQQDEDEDEIWKRDGSSDRVNATGLVI